MGATRHQRVRTRNSSDYAISSKLVLDPLPTVPVSPKLTDPVETEAIQLECKLESPTTVQPELTDSMQVLPPKVHCESVKSMLCHLISCTTNGWGLIIGLHFSDQSHANVVLAPAGVIRSPGHANVVEIALGRHRIRLDPANVYVQTHEWVMVALKGSQEVPLEWLFDSPVSHATPVSSSPSSPSSPPSAATVTVGYFTNTGRCKNFSTQVLMSNPRVPPLRASLKCERTPLFAALFLDGMPFGFQTATTGKHVSMANVAHILENLSNFKPKYASSRTVQTLIQTFKTESVGEINVEEPAMDPLPLNDLATVNSFNSPQSIKSC